MAGKSGLVLSRLEGERLIITDGNVEISVEVAEVDRGKVKLRVAAPQNWDINREEIHQRIAVENKAA